MSLSRFSVQKPIFVTMITLIVVIIGVVSLTRLRIDLLPDIELPTLTIRTQYEGASPVVMERLVTQIIEEIVGTVPGVKEMTSQSSEGNSSVRVSFVWGTEIDAAALDVQATLEDEINELPDDIVRPRVSKFDIASFPVVILGISSDLDPVELTNLIEDQIRYRFGRIPGVAQVDLWGGFSREVRIELDPDRINALGLPLDRVLQAVRDANLDVPAGKIEEGRYEVTLRAPAEFVNLDQIRDTVVVERSGAAVTLGQIAEVTDTYEKLTRIIRVNGERGLRVAIRKQADANTVEVSRLVLAEIDAVNNAFPQISIIPVINQGNFIERSIANVSRSVMYGGGLAIFVLLFFLLNLRSTVVISLAIPISVIATFALLYVGGFTLNLMTLGGLALGVGMMVDSSIVVLENIYRHRSENNESPENASIKGTQEVASAIIASTITTLVIFLPLVFVRGVAGILFKELAFVIMFALACSLLVSLSLVPMLASKLLRRPEEVQGGRAPWIVRLTDASHKSFSTLNSGYRDLIRWVLANQLKTVFIATAIVGSSLLLLPMIGTEFLPPGDEGEVRITGEMEVGSRLETVDKQTRRMEKIIYNAVPEAVSSVVSVGASGWRPTAAAQGNIRISLTPATQRERSNSEIADDLRRRLTGQVPGMKIRTRAPQGQFLLDRILGGDEGLTVEVRGFDLHTLDALAGRVASSITGVPGITDVHTSREAGIPQQEIRVDRDKVADLGLSVRDVTEVLETAIAGTKAGEFRTQGNSYRILVQLKDAEKRSLDEVLNLTLTTASGEQTTLRNVVVTEQRNYEEQQKSFDELMVSLLLALTLVYMVLACQYESLRDPLVVMTSVPLAILGVLVILFLTNTTLNLQSYIGCIMLGGIVVNNAILLVDQAGRLRQERISVREAVAEAGRRRLRPILMTTLTTILALLPLAFGIGEGADMQAPLARAVVGGLTGSTLITLVLIPAIYSLFHPEGRGKGN
jgi:HAE1 family hydrophobic/amphiphilic exporter-1